MFSRLGFAVAVHTDSDIFLVDEVLAVGDRPFKKKCMARMQEIRGGPHHALRQPRLELGAQDVRPGARSSRRASLGYDGPVDEGIQYLQYDDDPEDDVNSEESEDDDIDERARRRHLRLLLRDAEFDNGRLSPCRVDELQVCS